MLPCSFFGQHFGLTSSLFAHQLSFRGHFRDRFQGTAGLPLFLHLVGFLFYVHLLGYLLLGGTAIYIGGALSILCQLVAELPQFVKVYRASLLLLLAFSIRRILQAPWLDPAVLLARLFALSLALPLTCSLVQPLDRLRSHVIQWLVRNRRARPAIAPRVHLLGQGEHLALGAAD